MSRAPFARRRTARGVLAAATLACVLALAGSDGGSSMRADGGVLEGVTTLLASGDTAVKIDLVFLGDGFTSDQQDDFNARVDTVVAAFLAAHPIQALRSAFNIHRVNVSSPESGTDKFSTCGTDGSGNPKPTGDPNVSRRTAMDSGYCGGGSGTVYRCVGSSDVSLVLGFAASAPDDDVLVVLINDGGDGGCRSSNRVFMTLSSRFAAVVVHELGHAIFDLADEYSGSDRVEDTYTGGEPGRPNITIGQDRTTLKWRELVLSGTAIPTQGQSDCTNPSPPDRNVDADLVGTFEGADRFRCGSFRPQHTCRMRESNQDFCSVCRRAIIRHVLPMLGSDRAVFFRDLLVRDDHDGWGRGSGDIYLNYDLRADAQQVSGRWPGSGDSGFDSGDSKTLNVFAGLLSDPASNPTVEVRVRDGDWPDGDDTLSSDATSALPAAGPFEVDRSDYRLRGDVRPADLRVLLDVLNVKDDSENWVGGAGDIFVEYTITNGSETVSGRWPGSGTTNMGDHDSSFMKVLAASLPAPADGNPLGIRIRVMDDDGWLTGGDDEIGEDTFELSAAEDFGATATTHVRDQSNYRITFSVARRPPEQIP